MDPAAPLVHEALGSNVAIDSTLSYGDVEGAFASAAVIVRDHLYWGTDRRSAARDGCIPRELRPGERD